MKEGYKTSEFWITIGLILLSTLGELSHVFPAHWAAVVSGTAGSIYVLARTVLKLLGQGGNVDLSQQVADEVTKQLQIATSQPATKS